MKLVLTFVIFFSFLGSSFAYLGNAPVTYEATPYTIIYPNVTTITTAVAGPSPEEIALTARIDSQEVQMNLLFNALDSMNRVQIKQTSSIKRLKRRDKQSATQLQKRKQKSKATSDKSTWIISLLGVTTAIAAFFALRLFLTNKSRRKADDE